MDWLKAAFDWLWGLFPKPVARRIYSGIRRTAPYLGPALEIAGLAATIMPGGRTVAGILAVAQKLGVDALLKSDATDAELDVAIRDVVVAALRLKFPGAGTADLNRAVELAVGAIQS